VVGGAPGERVRPDGLHRVVRLLPGAPLPRLGGAPLGQLVEDDLGGGEHPGGVEDDAVDDDVVAAVVGNARRSVLEAGFAAVRVETIRKRNSKKELFEFDVTAHKP